MKLSVVYTRSSTPSGKALAAKIAEMVNEDIQITHGKSEDISNAPTDVLISFGSASERVNATHFINNAEAVSRGANKREARQIFEESEVPAPKLYQASDIRSGDLPVIGRPDHHMRGRELYLCRTLREVRSAVSNGSTHFMTYIPDTREFRIHICAGNVGRDGKPTDYRSIKISEKVRNPDAPNRGQDTVARNHRFGWAFASPDEDVLASQRMESCREAAKKAVASLGLHFGAVDILMDRRGHPYVLEVNTAPCLTDQNANTCSKYADAIMRLVSRISPRSNTVRPTRERPEPAPTRPRRAARSTPNHDEDIVRRLLNNSDEDVVRSLLVNL